MKIKASFFEDAVENDNLKKFLKKLVEANFKDLKRLVNKDL